ncbi:MAG: hypothetical protein ABIE43_03365 [Patescibacteria group bacterium]
MFNKRTFLVLGIVPLLFVFILSGCGKKQAPDTGIGADEQSGQEAQPRGFLESDTNEREGPVTQNIPTDKKDINKLLNDLEKNADDLDLDVNEDDFNIDDSDIDDSDIGEEPVEDDIDDSDIDAL